MPVCRGVIEGVSPTEVLETGKFEQFVEWARNNYSVIIIDSPPLGILSEAIVFGRGYGYQYYGYPRHSKRYAAAEKPRKRRDKSAPA